MLEFSKFIGVVFSVPLAGFAILSANPAIANVVRDDVTCMTGSYGEVAQVSPEDQGLSYNVIVADEDVSSFEMLGFIRVECEGKLLGLEELAAERDRVCESAYWGNEAVQEQLRRALGVHPISLCQTVEKVAGGWSGDKSNSTHYGF